MIKLRTLIVCLLMLSISHSIYSQDLNLQNITPSSIMNKGQVEIKLFNNLYTQQAFYNSSSEKQEIGFRENYFTSANYFLIGVNSWLNIGGEIWINSVNRNTDPEQKRVELSYVAPKIKIAPFTSLERFSITSTLLIPIANDMQGGGDLSQPFLAFDNTIWINQLFYDQQLGQDWQVFFELSGWMYFRKPKVEESDFFFRLPTKAILSYFPTQRVTLYLLNELMTQFGETDFVESYYFQLGPGIKYQLVPGKVEIEGLYTNFVAGKSQGAGSTFNLGLRVIR
ncbi:MAG: hypothetical protein L3J29_04660 [Cyclobacteriaceae bacterium]|nr:hypothetical protein [Cyclobacteriaceae bacterium]